MNVITREIILALKSKQDDLLAKLLEQPSGLSWCAEHAQIADEVAVALFNGIAEDLGLQPHLAIIATGGFGRRELCVRSDIDITIVPGDETSAELDSAIRRLFQEIHWAYSQVLRLDVGYAYRLLSDSSGLDARTRTGLLDMRLLAGSESLFRDLQTSLSANLPAGEFVLAKIEERNRMYKRYHDTPLVAEPQLKEGAGGLRDFHCASWIGEAIGERSPKPDGAYDCILRYRNLLHFRSGKAQDSLSRSRQGEISDLIGKSPQDIVAEVTNAGEGLFATYCRAKERLHEARFELVPGVVSVRGEVRVLPECSLGSAANGIAFATRLGLSVSDLPAKAVDFEVGPAAMFAISFGERTLRNLDRCTLLEQLLPQLTACRNLVGDDSAHTYTVMEHTLRVIRNLDHLEPPGFLGDLRAAVVDSEPLYLACLLHDVGKIDPERDHSEGGAAIAEQVVQQWGLDEAIADMVVWLIREHLTMARFIRIRDLSHPSTIEEFARIVGQPERLKLLTLLTYADINAVGVGSWTMAQETFMRQLHDQTLARLQEETWPLPEVSQSRQRLLRQLRGQTENPERISQFLESLPAYYLTSVNADLIRIHMALAARAETGQATVEHHSLPEVNATEVTVCAPDSPALLSHLLGVLYAQDLSLVGLKACTTTSANPVAIDVFTVTFAGRPVPAATLDQTRRLLLQVIEGSLNLEELLTSRSKNPNLRQEISRWSFQPGSPGVLEVRTPRGRGMPFRLSRLFAAQGWNIFAARVGQWAGTGAAAFYLGGPSGEDLTREQFQKLFDRRSEDLRLVK